MNFLMMSGLSTIISTQPWVLFIFSINSLLHAFSVTIFLKLGNLTFKIADYWKKNDKQINIFVNSEQFLIFIAYICEVLIKTNSSNVIQKMAKLIQ